ncbi:MAG: type VI secretion system membrane subunit TssM, partial [Limnobacter sp.]|nr:type VI secretion system membrane subunit TssM [Limnobacter sp.]
SVKGVGGTRHCDWWFTDEAVLIDTAGRFSTQDSHQETDAAAWLGFLSLLKQTRPKQPVNGVILTLSVSDLLGSPVELEVVLTKLRKRLQEITDQFGFQVPIYFWITKLDLIPGFSETFAHMTAEEIKQGCGFTLPEWIETDDSALIETLLSQFNQIRARIKHQLQDRLQTEHSLDRRRAMVEFSECLGKLAEPLRQSFKTVFMNHSRFSRANRLRGFYLSSGTQNATALGRLRAHLGTTGSEAVNSAHSRAFFIERVLKDVIFKESHLAGLVRKEVRLEYTLKTGLALASFLVASLAIGGWVISYQNNAQVVQSIMAKAQEASPLLGQEPDTAQGKPVAFSEATLVKLQTLRGLNTAENIQNDVPNWKVSLGLNQFEKLNFASDRAYVRVAEKLLIPAINQRLETQLVETYSADAEIAYEALKTYLMLHNPENRDIQALKQWILQDWSSRQLAHLNPIQQQEALNHLEAVLSLPDWPSLAPMQQELIIKSRQILGRIPIEQRIYNRLKRIHALRQPGRFDVLSSAGADLTGIFERAGGQSLSQGPELFFTRNAYLEFFAPQLAGEIANGSAESAWVLNERQEHFQKDEATQQQVRELYVRDYISSWRGYLNDIRPRPVQNLTHALETARTLVKPNSPLERFLRELAKNHQLGKSLQNAQNAVENQAERAANRHLNTTALLAGQSLLSASGPTEPPEKAIDMEFQSILVLFDESHSGYAGLQSTLSQLHNLLSAIEVARREQGIPPASSEFVALSSQANLYPEPVRGLLNNLIAQAGQQTQKAQLNSISAELRPIRDVCQNSIAGRYPFSEQSRLDVLPQDFTRFFGPNGLMQQYFDQQLAQKVDKSAQQWRFKPSGQPVGYASSSLVEFQRAGEITQVFFDGKPSPGFKVDVRLTASSHPDDVLYLQHDGQLYMFSQQYEPSHVLAWPPSKNSSRIEVRASEDVRPQIIEGPWALFRLFDNPSRKQGKGPEEFTTRVVLGSKWFDLTVTANT